MAIRRVPSGISHEILHNVECTQSEKALSTSLGVSFNELYCEAFPCKKSPLKSGICTFKFELGQIQLLKIFFLRNMLQLLQYRMRYEQKSIKSKIYMFFYKCVRFLGKIETPMYFKTFVKKLAITT